MRAEKLARQEVQPSSDMKVRAAWLYYVEGLTQEQIAQTMNIGRIKVVRLLAAAREEGLVRIRIEAKGAEQIALERRLVRELGLGEAIVVPAAADEADTATLVGHAAGSYLNDQVRDGMSIGIGWGATLHMSLKALGNGRYDDLSVISLMGGLTHSRTINPSAVARRVADAFGAECYQLTAPIFVANEAVRALLWEEPGLKELLDRARRVDIALVSVGNVSEEATLFRQGLLPRSQLESLRKAGAVGDVLCHFLDAEGNVVDHPFNRRIMAIDLDDIRRIPKVVVAAGGYSKVRAIRAALKATSASVLVTDEPAALGLLEG
ncbi:sugar-binding protein [Chelatococcus daeguensis]|uniref:Sugar-binding protein n=1 Tax=Chelatococcus daeguensis TaxID=444444 RepID=A0AAC9JMM2_9HYPH|nr:sugar-binding transcriptional regulator [Chelatococcus daeguensis]APF36522.1 sugar-binding protein [Chelatococcus daeguensis]